MNKASPDYDITRAERHCLLVVDDDVALRRLVRDHLTREGYCVREACNVAQMRRELARDDVQIVILDIMLPDEDGLSAARSLRHRPELGIIMVSALGSEQDRIKGLDFGADDYLPKPVSPAELVARVRALERRQRALQARRHIFTFEGWSIELLRRVLRDPNGVVIGLSEAEFTLLMVFIERPQMTLSRGELLELTRGEDTEAFDRVIDTQISRLRRKFIDRGADDFIRTVRGEGYMFVPVVHFE